MTACQWLFLKKQKEMNNIRHQTPLKSVSNKEDEFENENYKDRKCAVNKIPFVCIESAGSKTCDNHPLKNGSAVSNCLIVCW